MPISKSVKNHLKKASRDDLELAVSRLRRHVRTHRWIGSGNKYAKFYKRNLPGKKKTTDVIRRGGGNLEQAQIADYIAASVFTHCSDGWSLLGRAINLQNKGDMNSCVHLSYYAELRGAMSLLASEGIGVFSDPHVILTNSTAGAVVINSAGGTHSFVWQALEYWAMRKPSSEILGEIITPGSIKLSDWFDAFNIQTYLRPVASVWLKTWGVDIKNFEDDKVLRNHSSYRPSRILPRLLVSAEDSLYFSSEIWRMCEPDSASRFNEIDKQLLRESLDKIYKKSIRPFANVTYVQWIEKGVSRLGMTPAVQSEWTKFLTWNVNSSKSLLLMEAAGNSSVEDANYHLQVLARAALLLRISTGISGKLLRDAGFNKDDLEFWWKPYAVDHGIISPNYIVSDFLDLWDDIGVVLQDIENWKSSNSMPYSYNQLARNLSHELSLLSECERVALWGLGI